MGTLTPAALTHWPQLRHSHHNPIIEKQNVESLFRKPLAQPAYIADVAAVAMKEDHRGRDQSFTCDEHNGYYESSDPSGSAERMSHSTFKC